MQDFGTKSDDTAGPSGQLSAAEFNSLATELENAVLRSGQVLSGASVVQMAISLFAHGVKAQTFQDSGAVNAYVATPVSGAGGVLLPADYTILNGSVILFKAANANSGASTLNIGQTTGALIGAKAIVDQAGVALTSGAIAAGAYVQLRYDASIGAGSWVLLPASRPIASTAQAQAWASDIVGMTPLKLAQAFQGSNQSLLANGFQRIPGGWIEAWGTELVPAGVGGTVFSLPLTYPNAIFGVVASHLGTSSGAINVEAIQVGLNQIRITHDSASAANVFYKMVGR